MIHSVSSPSDAPMPPPPISQSSRSPKKRHSCHTDIPRTLKAVSGTGVKDHVPLTLKQHESEMLRSAYAWLLFCFFLFFSSSSALRIRGFHIPGVNQPRIEGGVFSFPAADSQPRFQPQTANHLWMENSIFTFPTADSQTRIPTLGLKLCAWSNLQMLRANCR